MCESPGRSAEADSSAARWQCCAAYLKNSALRAMERRLRRRNSAPSPAPRKPAPARPALPPARPAAAEQAAQFRPPQQGRLAVRGVGWVSDRELARSLRRVGISRTPSDGGQRAALSTGAPGLSTPAGFRPEGPPRGWTGEMSTRRGGLGGAQAPRHVLRSGGTAKREKGCPERPVIARPPPALLLAQPCTSGSGALHFLPKKCLTVG